MDNEAKSQFRAIIAALVVVITIAIALWAGFRTIESKPHVVGSLGGNPQGGPPAGVNDPALPADKAAAKGQ